MHSFFFREFRSFTFNLHFLYELKHMVQFSKTMWRIFHFRFCLDFIKVCLFFYSLTLKRGNSFQNENSRKATHSFAPKLLIFKLEKEVWKFNNISVSWSSKNWPGDELFKLRKSKFWLHHFFSIGTFKTMFSFDCPKMLFL